MNTHTNSSWMGFLVLACFINLAGDARGQDIEIKTLAKSQNAGERFKAAELIAFKDDQSAFLPILWELLKDDEEDVAGRAALTLSEVCAEKGVSLDFAIKAEALLRARLDKLKAPDGVGFDDGEKSMWLSETYVLCLRAIYYWFPLASLADYKVFEAEYYQPLTLAVASKRNRLSARCAEMLLPLVNNISDPHVLIQIVRILNEGWLDTPEDRCEPIMLFIWKHPILGEGGVMHEITKKVLAESLSDLKQCGSMIKNPQQKANFLEVLQSLMQVETLVRKATQ